MFRNIIKPVIVLLLIGGLAACSSPEEKAADYIQNATVLFEEGNLEKAELEFKNALQINQNLPDAWYGLAKIHESRQEWKQVYGLLSKVREMAPNHVDARIKLGQILLASGQIDQALEDAGQILELAPNDTRSHSLMAAVQFRLENFDAAQQSVDRSLALDPGSDEAILVRARIFIAEKRYDEALDLLDEVLQAQADNVSLYLMKIQAYTELDDKPAVKDVYKALIQNFPENSSFKQALVRQHIEDGEIDQAEKLLAQIVQSNPQQVEAKLNLVRFKFRYRSADEAIALMKAYIEQDSSEYRLRFALVELYQDGKSTDEAIALLRGIIVDDGVQPNGLEARNKLALIYLRNGERDEAQALVDEVLANDNTNQNALLFQAGFKLAEKKYDDAIVDLRTVLRDNPNSIKALGLIGQAYTALGSTELAIESLGKAFSINPGNPVIVNSYASILMRNNDPQRADDVLQQSIEAGNRGTDVMKLMIQVKLRLGDWDRAEQLAQQLKGVEGQEALSQQMLGLVYQGKQQPDQSIGAFKRAHDLSPKSSEPIVALVKAYVGNNQVDKAESFLQTLIKENENNITAYMLLGQLSLRAKDTPAAIGYFTRTIRINPAFVQGYRTLAGIHVGGNKLADAENILREGLLELPGNTALTISLASVFEKKQDFDRAIEVYEGLLEKNPDIIVAKNNLASLLTDQRQDQASYDRARQIAAEFRDSPIPQFRDTYAWAAVKSGTNLEEAAVILESIVKDNEQVDVYHYHLGEAYRKKGDAEKAMVQLEKAIELAAAGSDVAEKAKASLGLLN